MEPRSARWRLGVDVAVGLVFTVFCLVVTNHIPPEEGERYNGWAVATIIVVGAGLVLYRRLPYVALAIAIVGLGIVHGGQLRRRTGVPRAAGPAVHDRPAR